MDYTNLKYIVTVAEYKSISKAADKLFVSQPNISKAIKSVEEKIGFLIFLRTAKGVEITSEGKTFINKAKVLLANYDEFISEYTESNVSNLNFCISYPRATYISYAISKFLNTLNQKEQIYGNIIETNSVTTISNVIQGISSIGIIRCNKLDLSYYTNIIKYNKLQSSVLSEFKMKVLISKNNPLAKKETLNQVDLKNSIAVISSDSEIINSTSIKNNFQYSKRNILISERGSQMSAIENISNAYTLVSPMPIDYLEKHNMITIPYDNDENNWLDIIIYKNSHPLNKYDLSLIMQIKKLLNENVQ